MVGEGASEQAELGFDIERIVRNLWAETPLCGDFHARSCAEPERFEQALFRFESGRAALKSDRGVAYDFFQDLCLRHVSGGQRAFVEQTGSGARALGFAELAARTRTLRTAWHRAGVKEGQRIAIVAELGEAYAVALLTALRMGVVACPVAPKGERHVQRCLDALAPDHVYASEALGAWLGPFAALRIGDSARGETFDVLGADSSVYAADEVVLCVCSPFDVEARTPVEITAHELFIGVLRDALLVLDAAPGRAVAWPGADTELAHPTLLFSCWAVGATFVHLTLEQLLAEPALLATHKLDVLGVGAALRDLVLSGHASVPKVRGWLRDPAEPFEWDPWDAFGQLIALEGARGGAALFVTSAAGALFFSGKARRPHLLALLPTPGRAFALTDVLGSGVPTDTTSGLYTPTAWEEPFVRAGYFLLSSERGFYLFAGALNGCPDGRPYPTTDAVAVLTESGLVDAASVVVRPTPGRLNDAYAVLVGFLDPLRVGAETPAQRIARCDRVAAEVRLALGVAAVPRRVALYELDPRTADGVVDARWCASQWSVGLLPRKAGHPAFRALSTLRRVVSGMASGS